MTKTCLECNTEFQKPKKFSVPQFQGRKYCGFDCWGKHQSKQMKGKVSPMYGRNHTHEAKEKNRIAHLKPNGVSKVPGYKSHHSLLRYARLKGSQGTFTLQEWEVKKRQFDYCCAICMEHESVKKLTKDHVVPITKGGSNYITNIQPLCQPCNSRKNNRMVLA